MEWLILLGLVIWVLVINNRLQTAERQIRSLQAVQPGEPGPFSVARERTVPQPEAPPGSVPVEPTPVIPPPSPTPIQRWEPPPPPHREVITRPARPTPSTPSARSVRPALSTWLSENGLAWVGGGALALGGALLVAYAAERGFFTPVLRILASIVLGFAMLATGEWLRRATRVPGGRHGLAAAVTSGAGASTLYAAVWSAYALYHFLPFTEAALLLAAVSLGLLALAVLHGEALALLALGGAFATPILCNPTIWSNLSLDGYLAVITATGLAATSLRTWSRAGMLTLAGIAVWIFGRQLAGDIRGGETLVLSALAMTLLAVKYRDVRAIAANVSESATRTLSRLPLVACIGSTVLWVVSVLELTGVSPMDMALVGAGLSVLCAAAVQMKLAPDRIVLAPAVGLALLAASHSDFAAIGAGSRQALWYLAPIAALAGSALALRFADASRNGAGVIGAAAGALSITLLRAPLAAALSSEASLLFIAVAGLFGAGAWLIVRRSANSASDLAVAAWVVAAAETLGVAIHAGLPGRPEPAAYGLLALGLALVARRLPWRGLPEASALACLVSLLSLFGPQIGAAIFTGSLSWSDVALAGGAGVLAQTACWWILRGRADANNSRETASTSAVLSGLLTLFLVLRALAAGHGAHPGSLDIFAEASFRTVLLLVAGLVLTVRGGASVLARARGPVLLAAGALHGLLLQMLILNPWWGFDWVREIPGPPVVDILALAFLAPALLLAAAARRQTKSLPWAAPLTALTALLYLLVWSVMETRRLFHGPMLGEGVFGYSEVVSYGVALLGAAWLMSLKTVRKAVLENASTTALMASAGRWVALVCSAYLISVIASPWWGPLDGSLRQPLLYFALFGAGIALTALFSRHEDVRAAPLFGEAIKVVVTLEAFAALTLIVRFAFHGGAMRLSLAGTGMETWTYSAAWAFCGLIVLTTGARGGDRTLRWLGLGVLLITTLKVFLFDMATLEGPIRAASFLALGALLVIGAVAVRRLGARGQT